MLTWLFQIVRPILGYPNATEPTLVSHRSSGRRTAIVLLHGFSGKTIQTWRPFLEHLLAEPAVRTWDVYGIGYPSSLRVDIPQVWSADPDLDIAARSLRTALSLSPLRDYRCLALVAHSMGGLIVQRALLDDEALRRKVSHVVLFGTPSTGLRKSGLVSGLKRQFKDMASDGPFVTKLREDWNSRVGSAPPFAFRAVAGDIDEFVPATSSLRPFPDACRAVVPGDHLGIIRPTCPDHRGLRLLVEMLSGAGQVPGAVDGARLALELGCFREAADILLPRAAELDEAALASLALALEGLGRGQEALEILERHGQGDRSLSTTDAIGILAGRLKRRWLVERSAVDLDRARELYLQGLEAAERRGDHDQAYYHAINIAFLDLMASPLDQPVPLSARNMAERALEHCKGAAVEHWRLATEAEASLILKDLPRAEALYRQALAKAQGPRGVQSMYSQAVRVAARVCGEDGTARIEQLFEVGVPVTALTSRSLEAESEYEK